MFPLSTLVREHVLYNVILPKGLPNSLFVKPALDAIEAIADGENAEIDAPEGYKWPNGKEYLSARRVVNLLHLEGFIQERIDTDEFDDGLDDLV
jgi:hypothetical protein